MKLLYLITSFFLLTTLVEGQKIVEDKKLLTATEGYLLVPKTIDCTTPRLFIPFNFDKTKSLIENLLSDSNLIAYKIGITQKFHNEYHQFYDTILNPNFQGWQDMNIENYYVLPLKTKFKKIDSFDPLIRIT